MCTDMNECGHANVLRTAAPGPVSSRPLGAPEVELVLARTASRPFGNLPPRRCRLSTSRTPGCSVPYDTSATPACISFASASCPSISCIPPPRNPLAHDCVSDRSLPRPQVTTTATRFSATPVGVCRTREAVKKAPLCTFDVKCCLSSRTSCQT
jgi:hypothetical protein